MTTSRPTTIEPVPLLRAAFDALERQDFDAVVDMMVDDFRINIAGMPTQKRGIPAWRRNIQMMFSAFPDLRVHIQDIFAEGNLVAMRVRFTGTHRGEFLGIQPTGKRIDYLSHEIYRVENGRIAEEWICSDLMTLLTQIGGISSTRLISMWLAGHRTWFALAGGLLGGAAAGMALSRLLR
ncbi:ester cyclase [Nesterenkonia sp. K-15-9-6]|uniref:ester cyclase n=1 Tax=Nesterenkonia sp. K-15-9-6 TaxID=3093918 RepID=UPI004044659C